MADSKPSKIAVAGCLLLLMLAFLLPVCHLHPPSDARAPEHCTICIALHAAIPMGGVHLRPAASVVATSQVVIALVSLPPDPAVSLATSRAPPVTSR